MTPPDWVHLGYHLGPLLNPNLQDESVDFRILQESPKLKRRVSSKLPLIRDFRGQIALLDVQKDSFIVPLRAWSWWPSWTTIPEGCDEVACRVDLGYRGCGVHHPASTPPDPSPLWTLNVSKRGPKGVIMGLNAPIITLSRSQTHP